MAYREFRNEATYKAPEIGQLLPQTMGMLDTAMKIRAQREQHQANARDNFKVLVEKGYDPEDQNFLNNHAAETTNLGIAASMQYGFPNIAPVKQRMAEAKGISELSGRNSEIVKAKIDEMDRLAKDPNSFYDPTLLKQELEQQYAGIKVNGIDDVKKKSEIAQSFDPLNQPLKTFKEDSYLKWKVDQYGQKQKSNQNTDKNGKMTAMDYSGQFVDENGVPGRITDDIISDVVNDPKAKSYYDARVVKDIQSDLSKIVAGRMEEIPNTKEGNILRNMIDNGDPSAVFYLKENPELNPIDQRTDFQRKKEMVEPELRKREKVSIDSKVDRSKTNDYDRYGSNGSVSKDMQFANGFTPNNGASMIAVTKTGNTPSVKGANPGGLVKNATTGETFRIGGSGTDFSINDWHIGVVDNKGVPIDIPGNTLDESLEYIRNAPIEVVKQWNASVPVARGTVLNKASTIDAKQRLKKEADRLRVKAERTPEEELEMQELAKQVGSETLDLSSELVQKYLGDMVTNVSYKIDKVTSGGYEARTGIDPLNQKALTPEMKEMKAAIDARIKEARPVVEEESRQNVKKSLAPSEGVKPKETLTIKGQIKPGDKPPTVSSQADYDALPSGAIYLDPEGNQRKKK